MKACASSGHWKSKYYLSDIINGSIVISDKFKAGIAFSCFVNRQSKFSLDREYLNQSIKLLNQINEDDQKHVYSEIKKIMNDSISDEFDKLIFNESLLKELSKSVNSSIPIWIESNQQGFETLIENSIKYFA